MTESRFSRFTLIALFALSGIAHAQSLPPGVSELQGTSPSLSEADIQSLDSVFESSRIVALGESSHGSAGYSAFQQRLVQRAVTQFGYRKLLMELVTNAPALNAYLENCEGNITNILYHGAWFDDHAQRVSLYQWLCAWNQAHPNDKVRVESVDPQKPWVDAPVIRSFLHSISASLEAQYADPIEANCFGANHPDQLSWAFAPETSAYYSSGGLPPEKVEACLSTLDALKHDMEVNIASWIATAGAYSYFDTVDAVRSLRAWEVKSQLTFTDFAESLAVREAAFGPSMLWKSFGFDLAPQKSIFIAHNLHVSQRPLNPTSAADPWQDLITVGVQAKQAMGSKYKVIAQSGYQVSAMFYGNFPIPTSPDSIDLTLHALNKPWLLVDTSAHWLKDKDTWFTQEERIPNGRPYDLKKSFDYLVFHDVSPAAAFLGAGKSQRETRMPKWMMDLSAK